MKIAYINFFYSKENMSGVEKKLMEEAVHYVDKGIDVYLLNTEEEGIRDNIIYKNVYNYFALPSVLAYFYVRLFTYNLISKIVPLQEYDKIYLRYPLMDLSALHFAKHYGYKLITQHHTKELEEIGAYKINPLFKLLQFTLEKWLAPKFFQYVPALTAMSDDVIAYEKERLGFSGETYRFSNGITAQNFTMESPPPLSSIFHLTIVASHYSPWHGLNRLLESLKHYHDLTCKIHLHIVGEVNTSDHTLIEAAKNNPSLIIELHGKLFAEDLDSVFSKTHMACDSLAMYRLDMNESSTLKSKEYIARGIPFIYSALDKDMQGVKGYLYDAGNKKNLFDFHTIVAHYRSLDLLNMQVSMKRCVDEVLDWKIKVNQLIKFLSRESVSR